MEAMQEAGFVGDGKGVIDVFCLRSGFLDRDGVAELLEQAEYAWAEAGQIVGVMQHNFQAIAAIRKQKGAQQIVAEQRGVAAIFQVVIENAQAMPGELDQDIDRFSVVCRAV